MNFEFYAGIYGHYFVILIEFGKDKEGSTLIIIKILRLYHPSVDLIVS